MGDHNEFSEYFPDAAFEPKRMKVKFNSSAQTFELEADEDEDDFIIDIPEDRLVLDGSCTLHEGFKAENHKSFLELKQNMEPIKEEPTILKEVLREGRGPLLSEKISAKIVYQLFVADEPKPFDTTFQPNRGPVTLQMDSGPFVGFSFCLNSMRVHEVASFLIPSSLAFGKYGLHQLVPQDSPIYAEIEVMAASTVNNVKDCEESEDFTGPLMYKVAGNKAFKEGKYQSSIRSYKSALGCIDYAMDSENFVELNKLELTIHVNLAISYQKVGKPEKAIEHCMHVLDSRPHDTKALFHLGRSYRLAGQYEKAKKTLLKGSQLLPNSQEFYSELEKEVRERTHTAWSVQEMKGLA